MSTLEGRHFNRRTTIYWVLNIANLTDEKIEAYKNNGTKMTAFNRATMQTHNYFSIKTTFFTTIIDE